MTRTHTTHELISIYDDALADVANATGPQYIAALTRLHCAREALKQQEPDYSFRRHTSPQKPVTDPKEQSDMQDMGDGNYRRMAAYTE